MREELGRADGRHSHPPIATALARQAKFFGGFRLYKERESPPCDHLVIGRANYETIL